MLAPEVVYFGGHPFGVFRLDLSPPKPLNRVRVPAFVLELAWVLERNRCSRDGFHAGAS